MNHQAIKQAAERLAKDTRLEQHMVSSLDDPAEVMRSHLDSVYDFARELAAAMDESANTSAEVCAERSYDEEGGERGWVDAAMDDVPFTAPSPPADLAETFAPMQTRAVLELQWKRVNQERDEAVALLREVSFLSPEWLRRRDAFLARHDKKGGVA